MPQKITPSPPPPRPPRKNNRSYSRTHTLVTPSFVHGAPSGSFDDALAGAAYFAIANIRERK